MSDLTMALDFGALLFAILLFFLRVLNYAIGTMRLVFIARDYRMLAAITAFMEALIFALVMAQVLDDISNLTNLLAYCFGAAIGSYVGQWFEARMIKSYSTVTIIVREQGREIANRLRENNYGATLSTGEGRDGEVSIIRSTAINRDIPHLVKVVNSVNPKAFVDVEAARRLYRGWLPGNAPRGQR